MRVADKGGGGIVYFQYDNAGQRVRKVWEHSGLVEERIYIGGMYEVYRRSTTGGLQEERETLHVMDGTRRVAMVETKTVDGGSVVGSPVSRERYQLDNHLGTAAVELDGSGNVFSYEEFHPFGTTSYRSGDGAYDVSAKRYRYTGKERDEETGLDYHGLRYKASWLGRWSTADPLGMVDGPNLYSYVRGSPIDFHDPSKATVEDQTDAKVWAGYKARLQEEYKEAESQLEQASRTGNQDAIGLSLSRLSAIGHSIKEAQRLESSDEVYRIVDDNFSDQSDGLQEGLQLQETRKLGAFGLRRKDDSKPNSPDNLVLTLALRPGAPTDELLGTLAHEARHAAEYDEGQEAVAAPPTKRDIQEIRKSGRRFRATSDQHDELRAFRREERIFGSGRATTTLEDIQSLYEGIRRDDVSGDTPLKTGKTSRNYRDFGHAKVEEAGRAGRPISSKIPLFKGWRDAYERGRASRAGDDR